MAASLLLLLSATSGSGSAAESALFGSHDTLALEIEAPWSELTRRPESGRTRRGQLRYDSATGETVRLDVTARTRGKSRLEVCSSPLLTLEFNSGQTTGTIFEDHRVVHLTSQCQVQSIHLQYLMHEYLAYRVFALLSEHALRVRLLSVEYVDPESKRRPRPRQAFLVEDIGLAAERQGMEWHRPESVDPSTLDGEARAVFILFQYLIGNTDWSIVVGPEGEACCHNAAIFRGAEEASALVPIPFDLDSAGLVDAKYIVPDPQAGVRSARQRVYRGFCDLNPHVEDATARFRAAEAEIRALFADSKELSPRSKKSTAKYLDEFFEVIGDPQKLATEILDQCRPR